MYMALTSHPSFIRNKLASSFAFAIANLNGVCFSLLIASLSAPLDKSSFMTSMEPYFAA